MSMSCLTRALAILVLTCGPVFADAGGADRTMGGATATSRLQEVRNLDPRSFMNLGGMGLINTRTARFLADGTIAAGVNYADPLANYFLTWQATPWLEATARYGEARGEPNDLDRALDLKIRLVEEGNFAPAIAIGFQDVLGNGPYSGEYLVFSKTSGDFDISFGIGWGAPAARGGVDNPFEVFSGSFKRRNDNIDQTGVPAFGNYFSGERMGVFGGVEYKTPLRGLTVKLEYDGGDDRTIPLGKPIRDDFPLNAGLNYRPFKWLDVAAGITRGEQPYVGVSFRTSLHSPPRVVERRDPAPLTREDVAAAHVPTRAKSPVRQDRKVPVVLVPHTGETDDRGELTAAVTRGLFDAGFPRPLVELEGDEARIQLSLPPEEAGARSLRAAYEALSRLPPRYRAVRFINRDGDEVGREGQVYTRETVERFARVDAAFDDLRVAGGVSAVEATSTRVEVEMTPHRDGSVNRTAVAAAADLIPGAEALEVRTPDGERLGGEASAFKFERTREHLARYMDTLGFDLEAVGQAADRGWVKLEAQGRFTEGDLARAADGALVILNEEGSADFDLLVEVLRNGVTVAETNRPLPTDSAPGAAQDGVPEGTRYLPLFGFVRWDPADDDRLKYDLASPPMPEESPQPSARSLAAGEVALLKRGLEDQGLRPVAWRVHGTEAEVAVANDRFETPAKVVGRAARALTRAAPGDVDWLKISVVEDGVTLSATRLLRRDVDGALDYAGSPEEIWLNTDIAPGDEVDENDGWARYDDAYPRLGWALYPELKQHFGGGEDGGYRAHGYLTLAGDAELWPGLSVEAALSREIAGNLDKVPPGPSASVPRVRSDIARYVEEGETAITRAMARYVTRPAKDIYLEARAGLLEPMYAGAGVEALYRPHGANYAVGVDLTRAKQRDFDQLLGMRDYAVWTGHVSLYREWPGLRLEGVVRAGRYLAGDWGATIDVYRRFDNGIRMGAWASATDMPRGAFGRDSYAKGLYLAIPLDILLPWSMRREVTLEARALNRDGGQMLDLGGGLYERTRPGTARALRSSWQRLMD